MAKRAHSRPRSVDEGESRLTKLRKLDVPEWRGARRSDLLQLNLEYLPDELLLRVLSFLTLEDLIRAQRYVQDPFGHPWLKSSPQNSTSRRISLLAKDSQLWKQLYFERFVYRRFGRVVGKNPTRQRKIELNRFTYNHHGKTQMDWKSKYRLSHKWSNGTCNYHEIMLASKVLPRTFLCLRGNMAITADRECGLRAWKTRDEKQTLVASASLRTNNEQHDLKPSALSVEVDLADPQRLDIVLGFTSGHIRLYTFHLLKQEFQHRQTFPCFRGQVVSALAQSTGGYFLAMADNQAMSLFKTSWAQIDRNLPSPQLISSLRSQSDWKPVSVNLRTSAHILMACIIYAYPRFLSGWSVGLQELRWDITTHELLSTRLATSPQPESLPKSSQLTRTIYLPPTSTKPTSLCYTHPYLLATHPDNTLSLYMVRSTDAELSIGPGMRLWGHTSDIYAANIGDHGKAVTIAYGGDVRVWQLEEGLTSALARKATPGPLVGVKLQPTPRGDAVGNVAHGDAHLAIKGESVADLGIYGRLSRLDEPISASVDFDEERLVVLQNRGTDSQALFIYDFT